MLSWDNLQGCCLPAGCRSYCCVQWLILPFLCHRTCDTSYEKNTPSCPIDTGLRHDRLWSMAREWMWYRPHLNRSFENQCRFLPALLFYPFCPENGTKWAKIGTSLSAWVTGWEDTWNSSKADTDLQPNIGMWEIKLCCYKSLGFGVSCYYSKADKYTPESLAYQKPNVNSFFLFNFLL